jgi:hypothetical protein
MMVVWLANMANIDEHMGDIDRAFESTSIC